MAVYTRRLGVVSGTAPSVWLEICRAQSAAVTIVRDVVLTNAGTAPVAELALRVRPLTKAGEWWLYYAKPFEIGTVRIDLRQELVAGEALEIYSTSTGTYVAVTGYVFAS